MTEGDKSPWIEKQEGTVPHPKGILKEEKKKKKILKA